MDKRASISSYPDQWKSRLLQFVVRPDQNQALKQWCGESDISYSTARDWLSASAVKQMESEIGELSGYVGSAEKQISACSATELLNAMAIRESREKSTIPSAYLDILPEDEQAVFIELHKTGLDLRGELTFLRYQLRRAKKHQVEQERLIESGQAESALVLVEQTTVVGVDAEGKAVDTTTDKKQLADWDTVMQRLGQLFASVATAQQKIEYGERLTSEERTDVMARTLRRVISGEITALEAGYLLNTAGIDRIPVTLELKIKEELSMLGDDFGERPADPQHAIDEEKRRRAEESEREKREFLAKREKELEALDLEEDS